MSETSLPITYVRIRSGVAARAHVAALPFWFCAVQAIVAYQWLLSGLNKLVNVSFSARLPVIVQQSVLSNPYSWYVALVRDMVLPHIAQYATLLAWTETAVGGVLLLGALLWVVRPGSALTALTARTSCLALAAAAVINLNGYLLSGSRLPWIDPARAYGQSVPFDALMALVALALLGAQLDALRRS